VDKRLTTRIECENRLIKFWGIYEFAGILCFSGDMITKYKVSFDRRIERGGYCYYS